MYVFYSVLAMILALWLLHFKFIPKNSSEIYSTLIAHRGLHMLQGEDSLESITMAVNSELGIELDVRRTKDNVAVCFHDKYTFKMLGIPGKLNEKNLSELLMFDLSGSKYPVQTLNDILNFVSGKVLVLLDIKEKIDKEYLDMLVYTYKTYYLKYGVTIYFHTARLKNYIMLNKCLGKTNKQVFWIWNIFRRRFNYIKGKDYSNVILKYNELVELCTDDMPSVDDFLASIAKIICNVKEKKEVVARIGSEVNKYATRINSSHWVLNSLWIHRAIVSSKYLEHSRESFISCIDFAKKNGINITVEFDITEHNSKAVCYHEDRISNIFGQPPSCAKKQEICDSLELDEVLSIFNGIDGINLAIDIKDAHIKDRSLEDKIIQAINSCGYLGNFILMSYNPFVLKYFKDKKPEWLRAQIGHSLSGLRKLPIFKFSWILNGILGMLFDIASSDCTVFDNSKWVFGFISYHRNIQGKPVLIYAPKNYKELEGFIGKEVVSNFIIENAEDTSSWPEMFFERFKR